jgi:hypothetical protein
MKHLSGPSYFNSFHFSGASTFIVDGVLPYCMHYNVKILFRFDMCYQSAGVAVTNAMMIHGAEAPGSNSADGMLIYATIVNNFFIV